MPTFASTSALMSTPPGATVPPPGVLAMATMPPGPPPQPVEPVQSPPSGPTGPMPTPTPI